MANETLPAVMGTAQNLQKYLFSDNIKKKLEMALPKWLSVDRLLRVVFSSVLKNPKLLECTTESLLSAVMQCAQLGLEPILGRAHLIPYRNNKKPGKPLECQFQPGYQGLVDLAERSGKVETVKAHVVYENDHFEIEYGLNERLIHKPKMDGERGKPIGAYTVWTRTSGVKTYSFMILDDIYRDFRSKSVAYNYAIKDNRTDTPWIENESEMLKKSLIKRHQKLEPASVEFMTAVEVDNMAEIGERASHPLLTNGAMFNFPEDEKDVEALAKQFDEATKDEDQGKLKAFLEKSADHFELTVSEVKAEVMKDPNALAKFLEQFRGAKSEASDKDPIRENLPEEDWRFYDELKKVRGSSLEVRVTRDKERILNSSPEFQDWLENTKWKNVYKGSRPYPFAKEETPPEPQIAPPGGENEEDSEPQTATRPETEPSEDSQQDILDNESDWIDCSNANIAAERIKVTYCEGGCRFREGCKDYEAYLNKK